MFATIFKIFAMITFLSIPSVANAHGNAGHRHIQNIQCDNRLIHIPGYYNVYRQWVPGTSYYGIQCWDSMGNIISQTPITRPVPPRPIVIYRHRYGYTRPPARVIVSPRVPRATTRRPPVRPPVRRSPPPRSRNRGNHGHNQRSQRSRR